MFVPSNFRFISGCSLCGVRLISFGYVLDDVQWEEPVVTIFFFSLSWIPSLIAAKGEQQLPPQLQTSWLMTVLISPAQVFRGCRTCTVRVTFLSSSPDPFPDEKNGRPHGTPTRQNSRRSEGGGDRCEWGDRTDGGGIGGSGGVLQRRGSAKERTRLLSSNGTQSQP